MSKVKVNGQGQRPRWLRRHSHPLWFCFTPRRRHCCNRPMCAWRRVESIAVRLHVSTLQCSGQWRRSNGGDDRPPNKNYRGESIFSLPECFSHFLGSSMPKLRLRRSALHPFGEACSALPDSLAGDATSPGTPHSLSTFSLDLRPFALQGPMRVSLSVAFRWNIAPSRQNLEWRPWLQWWARICAMSSGACTVTVYTPAAALPSSASKKQHTAVSCIALRRTGQNVQSTDKRPPGWFFTMRNLSRQTNEPKLDEIYARTLSHAVFWRRGLSTLSPRR